MESIGKFLLPQVTRKALAPTTASLFFKFQRHNPNSKWVLARGMAGLIGFSSLAPKTKNLVVAGGLTAFVFGVYFYTMRAVGGTDELQGAIDKFEQQKNKDEAESSVASKA